MTDGFLDDLGLLVGDLGGDDVFEGVGRVSGESGALPEGLEDMLAEVQYDVIVFTAGADNCEILVGHWCCGGMAANESKKSHTASLCKGNKECRS